MLNARQNADSNDPTSKLFMEAFDAKKKSLFGGLFMPTQHSVPQCPVPSVSGPFSAGEHRGGRG